jgi:hypothetical protein
MGRDECVLCAVERILAISFIVVSDRRVSARSEFQRAQGPAAPNALRRFVRQLDPKADQTRHTPRSQ